MKLGIDLTSIVLKKLANKIVLIAGDSDFVPVAKLARTEGAHVIIDTLGLTITNDLAKHTDDITTFINSIKDKYEEKEKEDDVEEAEDV